MNEKVHLPYHHELMESLAFGGDQYASMIRQSVFDLNEMPPAEVFAWYVRNSVYRLVVKRALHANGQASDEELEASAAEMAAIEVLLTKNKQLTLLHEVVEVLRVSELSVQ